MSAFDADISKYADLSEEVLAENAAESIKFLFVDCGPLKQVSASMSYTNQADDCCTQS